MAWECSAQRGTQEIFTFWLVEDINYDLQKQLKDIEHISPTIKVKNRRVYFILVLFRENLL